MTPRKDKRNKREDRFLELIERKKEDNNFSRKDDLELQKLSKKLHVKLPSDLKRSHLVRNALVINALIAFVLIGGIVFVVKSDLPESYTASFNNLSGLASKSPQPPPASSTSPSNTPATASTSTSPASRPAPTSTYVAPNFEYTPTNFDTGSSSSSCTSLRMTYSNNYQSGVASENQRYYTQKSQISSAISRLGNSGAGDSSAMQQFLQMQQQNESQHNATLNQLNETYQYQLASLSC